MIPSSANYLGVTSDFIPAFDSHSGRSASPVSRRVLLTPAEVADLLRTSRKAVYAMVERQQLPGVTRIGRRILVRSDMLLHWLLQSSAPLPENTVDHSWTRRSESDPLTAQKVIHLEA